ncbi:MAG: IS200/IS605 family transposase [Patescibacteria group bacterium]
MENIEDKHIKKSHNKSLLLYHVVCPVGYRKKVFTEIISQSIKDICYEISQRYEIHFVEIGVDDDHVHFMIQSVPTLSPKQIVQIVKSITARQLFSMHPLIRKDLWGGKFWTSGYYINTVSQYANAETIQNYVKQQGKKYIKISSQQPSLFDGIW